MSSLSKGQKRLLIVLAVVLAYGIFDVIKNKDRYLGYYGGGKKDQKVKQANVANVPQMKKTSTRRNAKYLQIWKEDPFYNQRFVYRRVVRKQTPAEVQLNLKAISYSGKNSVVMINDRIMMVGDIIHGYRINKILPNQVVLSKGSENKTLILR